MAFDATGVTLSDGLNELRRTVAAQKVYLQQWILALESTVDSSLILVMANNITRTLASIDSLAAMPGLAAYAQQQLNKPNYDIVTEYTAMRSALSAVVVWIKANLPSNGVSVAQGVITYMSFAPALTLPLKALLATANMTIS